MNKQVILLPGEGSGKEIIDAAKVVLNTIASEYGHRFTFQQHARRGDAYDQFGTPLPEDTVNACQSADAVLLGAVGGNDWDHVPVHLRPEKGLLGIRKALELFANLRPIKGFSPLLHASPLKDSVINGSDILIVRELTGGLYFGTPSERRENGNVAVDTMHYQRREMERIIDKGFQSAMLRN